MPAHFFAHFFFESFPECEVINYRSYRDSNQHDYYEDHECSPGLSLNECSAKVPLEAIAVLDLFPVERSLEVAPYFLSHAS